MTSNISAGVPPPPTHTENFYEYRVLPPLTPTLRTKSGGGARWGWGIIIKIKIYAPWLISLLMFIINRNKWKTKTIFMIYEMKVLFSRIVFLGLLTSP